MTRKRPAQTGMTVIELLIAVAIGALVLAALNSVVSLGLKSQSTGRQGNELVFQARFAMERMVTTARSVPPTLPPPLPAVQPGTGTTGGWFNPVMYCRNGSSQLIETTTADTGCTGTTVIANNVIVNGFFARLPLVTVAGPLDKPVAILSLTLAYSAPAAPQTVTLTTGVRLGGGTL